MFGKRTGLLTALVVRAAAQSNRDPCELAAAQQGNSLESMILPFDYDILYAPFDAKTAYDCVTSVPLNTSDAITMIEGVRSYLVFQTTTVFNANPPDSYQQPAIDIEARLDQLRSEVEEGVYDNQYDFDVAMQSIIVGVHDGHFSLNMGVYGLFSWLLPDTIVSVSSDGQEIPEVYAYSDVMFEVDNASPIVEIEGQDVFTYMADYVNRTYVPGYIEPHAEWNHVAWSAATEFNLLVSYGFIISRAPNNFQQTNVYNGESLSGRFANGTSFEWQYQAGSMTALSAQEYVSGDIILEQYVQTQRSTGVQGRSLRSMYERKSTIPPPLSPRNDIPSPRAETLRPRQMGGSNSTLRVPSYPRTPDVVQRNFGRGGFVSGYILDDISVGVLSIPSFDTKGGLLNDPGSGLSFSEAVREFIKKAKDADVQKVIIDVSGNTGGTVLQGVDTFKQFFPDTVPPMNTRGSATPTHNTMGRLLTGIGEDDGTLFSSIPDDFAGLRSFIALVTTASTDRNDQPWESYEEFFGPIEYNGGNFTNVTRYDLNSPATAAVLNQNITGYGDNQVNYEQPWAAEDIVVLHDGSCASTCSLFSDLIQHQANVRTVAVGGVPQYGPMQAVSGTRGSNTVTIPNIDGIIQQILGLAADQPDGFSELLQANGLTTDDLDRFPPPLSQAPWAIRSGAVNTLDIVRPDSDSPGTPWQFAYEAADCRVFYTAPMVRDITQLWRTVAKYADGNDDVCVQDSTGGFGMDPIEIFTDDPGFHAEDIWANANSTGVPDNGNSPESSDDGDDSSNSDGGDDDEGAASGLSASITGLVVAFGAVLMISL